jgi:tRNA (adenine22-N1)-methyltransferase
LKNHQDLIGLSPRLMQLAAWVRPGSRVLDVGTDHALLPIYLVQSGGVKSVIAGDVVEAPYQTARRKVQTVHLESSIDVRLGSGLSVVKPGEVDTVIIAGMGGATIAEILESGQDVLTRVEALLLQPMNASGRLRETLKRLGFLLFDERMVEESGRVYQLIFAQTASTSSTERQYQSFIDGGLRWLAFEFGPINLTRGREDQFPPQHRLVRQAVEEAREHFHGIITRFPAEAGDATADRRAEISSYLREMESWLKEDKA